MIIVKKAPAGYIAQMYVEDSLEFNTDLENSRESDRINGDPTAKPFPPHTHYGPDGQRFEIKTFLEESGDWKPTIEEAIRSLQSKKNIRACRARIDRAKQKLAWEERRLAGLLGAHRIYDNDSYEEILK